MTAAPNLSASELEALCQKAARGAGLSWGMSEEAGFAARWLYRRGIDSASALLSVLDRVTETGRPHWSGDTVRAGSGACLSPLDLGAALSDFAPRGPVLAGPVFRPVLVLPFLSLLAADGMRRAVAWSGGSVVLDVNGALQGDVASLARVEIADLHVSCPARPHPGRDQAAMPLPLDAAVLAGLDAYAMQVAVPATEASRADAGSDGDDNN